MRFRFSWLAPLLALFSCNDAGNLPTVPRVDVKRYAGKWYEVASFPQTFQKGCFCTTAEYTLSAPDEVVVENRCKRNGKTSYIKGSARVVKNSGGAKLKVQFFWPFTGNYWIIHLDPDYRWAVVSEPSKEYLWILSRTPSLPPDVLQPILQTLEKQGFDLKKLQYTRQDCP